MVACLNCNKEAPEGKKYCNKPCYLEHLKKKKSEKVEETSKEPTPPRGVPLKAPQQCPNCKDFLPDEATLATHMNSCKVIPPKVSPEIVRIEDIEIRHKITVKKFGICLVEPAEEFSVKEKQTLALKFSVPVGHVIMRILDNNKKVPKVHMQTEFQYVIREIAMDHKVEVHSEPMVKVKVRNVCTIGPNKYSGTSVVPMSVARTLRYMDDKYEAAKIHDTTEKNHIKDTGATISAIHGVVKEGRL